jgi:uncharacterized protein (TIGR02246 family)
MRKLATGLWLGGALVTGRVQAAEAPPSETAAITQVMQASADAWNRGDVKGFVAISYERGPDTVFVTAHGPVRGSDAIARRYADHYARQPGGMGRLSFTDISVRSLGPGYAILYGSYRLAFAGGKPPASGVFDLVFHKGADGWKIISDHSS